MTSDHLCPLPPDMTSWRVTECLALLRIRFTTAANVGQWSLHIIKEPRVHWSDTSKKRRIFMAVSQDGFLGYGSVSLI